MQILFVKWILCICFWDQKVSNLSLSLIHLISLKKSNPQKNIFIFPYLLLLNLNLVLLILKSLWLGPGYFTFLKRQYSP